MKTPLHKILIANRGEIALRIMRTARDLGYRTVAVYSSADRYARHVREADEAVAIGGALAAESYLNIEKIIAAAILSSADAVHPGYGFLAENASFAQACRDAGLIFIGPSPDAILAMGNKAGAKRLMMAAGVPCVPGYQGESQDEAILLAQARNIGFPVMIKATAGGGGRGMRLVDSADDFPAALRTARAEAQSAFGNPEVILERAIIEPRHIEIQIFADRYGNVVHFGERDCSVQRRHQKIIEEAPSPVVTPQLRAAMGQTCVAAAKAIAYEGAGTLEFLLDKSGNYYFMEMNTRLQVEHPVTEAITGLDLVALQLRVASGETLPIRQEDVSFTGHSIEVRLCAEDTAQSFMPQSGTMKLWQVPAGVRTEHALEIGGEISPFYDSMIAKLISHGATRDEALRKLISNLQDVVALGVKTNQVFVSNCLKHPVFADGAATTAFIGTYGDALAQTNLSDTVRARALAAILFYQTARTSSPSAIAYRQPVTLHLEHNEEACTAELLYLADGGFVVTIEDQRFNLTVEALNANAIRFSCNGLVEKASFVRSGTELLLQYRGVPYLLHDRTHEVAARAGNASFDGKMRASMNGRICSIDVSPGDIVVAGQAIFSMEAMKMQLVHAAPCAGKILALHAAMEDQVTLGRVIAEIEIAQEPALQTREAVAHD